MTTIYLAGSGAFGAAAAQALTEAGHTLAGIGAPENGRHGRQDPLAAWATRNSINPTPVSVLRPDSIPDGTDLIITAHSHAFIGRLTRARAKAAIGYHPSLLPLHRGRDAIKWQARLGERVTGGTIYHLTDRIDGGPIAFQQHTIIPPGIDHHTLWHNHLFPLGIQLITQTANHWQKHQTLPTHPQNDNHATWEPSLNAQPLHRPELLELEP